MVESASAALDLVFHALADPTRRSILRRVSRRSLSVGDVAKPFDMSLAAVSKHLNVLEHAGLIRRHRHGSTRTVEIRAERLRAAQQWLAYYEAFWTETLDRLQAHLEQDHEPSPHHDPKPDPKPKEKP